MPPTLSDADRFSGDDDDNGNDNEKSSSSFVLHVPRSTHREMVSNNVKRVSRDVPGFSDWRGSSSRSKSRGRDDTKEEDAAVVVELNFATRRRLNRSSSPGVVRAGGSEKCRKSRRSYQQVPSSKSTQSSRTAESISTSGKSDSSSMLSADHRYTEFGRPQRRRRERKERVANNNNNNNNTKTETISPTSKKEEVSFHESETTMKFDNTKAATVIKYRAAYEEILESIETLERFERSMSNDRSGRSNDGSGRLSESSSLSQNEGKDDKDNTNCNNDKPDPPNKDVNAALRRSLLRYVDEITAGTTLHSDNDDEGGDDDGMPALSSSMVNHEALVKKGVDDLLQSLILKTKEQAGTNARENPSSMREAKSPSRGHRDEERRDFGESIRSRDARRSSSSTESRRRSSSRTSLSDIEDEHASVSSQRSSKSILSQLSNRSQQSNRSQRSSKSYRSNRSIKDKDSAAENVSMGNKHQPTKKGGGGIFQRIKNLAGKVKTTLGVTGVHKFQLGESARYKTLKVKNKSWMRAEGTYDVETLTAAVDIVAVHIDAVLEMPYYTVQLSDGSLKRTNWDKLMTLSDYKKLKSLAAASDKVDGKVDDHLVNNGSTRDASAGRLRNMARRFSSPFRERDVDTTGLSVNDEDTALSRSINSSQRQGQEEQDGERKRRNHHNSSRRRRSSSKEVNTEEDRSTSKASSRRSSRSGNKGIGGRPISQIQGDSKSSRSRGGRPRSQSPFTRDRQCHTAINSQQPHPFHSASKPEFQAPVRNESSSVVEGRSTSPQSITTERISDNLEIATKPLTRKHSVIVVEDVTNNESMMW